MRNKDIQDYISGKISFIDLQAMSKHKDVLNINPQDKIEIVACKKKNTFKIRFIRIDYAISSITANHIEELFKEKGWVVDQELSKFKVTGKCSVCDKEIDVNDTIFHTGQCSVCEVQRNANYLLRVYNNINFITWKEITIEKLNNEDIDSFIFQVGRNVRKRLKGLK